MISLSPREVRVPIPAGLAQPLVDALTARLTASHRPVFVALDGRSGAGSRRLQLPSQGPAGPEVAPSQ